MRTKLYGWKYLYINEIKYKVDKMKKFAHVYTFLLILKKCKNFKTV